MRDKSETKLPYSTEFEAFMRANFPDNVLLGFQFEKVAEGATVFTLRDMQLAFERHTSQSEDALCGECGHTNHGLIKCGQTYEPVNAPDRLVRCACIRT